MKFYFYLLVALFLQLPLQLHAVTPDVLVTPKELGYSEKGDIIYFENIDDQYIGLIVSDRTDRPRYDGWIYDRQTRKAFQLEYSKGEWEYSINNFGVNQNLILGGMHFFHKEGNQFFTFFNEYNPDALGYRQILLITDIDTKENKALELGDCYKPYAFVSGEKQSFIVSFSDCSSNFSIYGFTDTSIDKVWSIDLNMSEPYYSMMGIFPFVYQNKIYVSDQHQLFVYDMASGESSVLIEDISDPSNPTEKVLTLPSQYIPYKDEVYIVFSDLSYELVAGISYKLIQKVGVSRIWKTDGNATGTELMYKIPFEEAGTGDLDFSKLCIAEDNFYWLGDLDTKGMVSVDLLHGQNAERIGVFSTLDFNPELDIFEKRIGKFRSVFPIPIYDNSLIVHVDGKPYIPQFYTLQKAGEFNKSVYVGLLSIASTSVLNQLQKNPLKFGGNFEGMENLHYSDLSVLKDNPYFGFFVKGFVINDIGYTSNSTLDYFRFKDILEDPVEHFNITTEGTSPFVYLEDEKNVNFIFGDTEISSSVLWELNNSEPTHLLNRRDEKNNLFTLFPNPTSDKLTVRSEAILEGQISIIGVDGRLYKTYPILGNSLDIDVSILNNGMYGVIFRGKHPIIAQKVFVVQK